MAITEDEKQALLNEVYASSSDSGLTSLLAKIIKTLLPEINTIAEEGGSPTIVGANGITTYTYPDNSQIILYGEGTYFTIVSYGGSPTAAELGASAITSLNSKYASDANFPLPSTPALGFNGKLVFYHKEGKQYYVWTGSQWESEKQRLGIS